jgi:hypothetical protein
VQLVQHSVVEISRGQHGARAPRQDGCSHAVHATRAAPSAHRVACRGRPLPLPPAPPPPAPPRYPPWPAGGVVVARGPAGRPRNPTVTPAPLAPQRSRRGWGLIGKGPGRVTRGPVYPGPKLRDPRSECCIGGGGAEVSRAWAKGAVRACARARRRPPVSTSDAEMSCCNSRRSVFTRPCSTKLEPQSSRIRGTLLARQSVGINRCGWIGRVY